MPCLESGRFLSLCLGVDSWGSLPIPICNPNNSQGSSSRDLVKGCIFGDLFKGLVGELQLGESKGHGLNHLAMVFH